MSLFPPVRGRSSTGAQSGRRGNLRVGTILVGTCSWRDESLVRSGRFYPKGVKSSEALLGYYASHFPLVEVDTSYYHLLTPEEVLAWSAATPQDFIFDVKAFRLFTQHWTPPQVLPRDIREAMGPLAGRKQNLYYRDVPRELLQELWRRFREALLPFHVSGKLGVVLLQFPDYFVPSSRSLEHILEVKEQMGPYRVAVEFRFHTWLDEAHRERTLRTLAEHELALVAVDAPQGFKSSLPPLAEATSDVAVVRFHGRNAATWEVAGAKASERFNWYYSEEELQEWVPRLQELASKTRVVHALMNTNQGDQGVVNARLLARALQLPLPQPSEEPQGQLPLR